MAAVPAGTPRQRGGDCRRNLLVRSFVVAAATARRSTSRGRELSLAPVRACRLAAGAIWRPGRTVDLHFGRVRDIGKLLRARTGFPLATEVGGSRRRTDAGEVEPLRLGALHAAPSHVPPEPRARRAHPGCGEQVAEESSCFLILLPTQRLRWHHRAPARPRPLLSICYDPGAPASANPRSSSIRGENSGA